MCSAFKKHFKTWSIVFTKVFFISIFLIFLLRISTRIQKSNTTKLSQTHFKDESRTNFSSWEKQFGKDARGHVFLWLPEAPEWYAENRLTKSSFQKISPSHYLSFSLCGTQGSPLLRVQPSVTRQDSDTHDYTKLRWNEFPRSDHRPFISTRLQHNEAPCFSLQAGRSRTN